MEQLQRIFELSLPEYVGGLAVVVTLAVIAIFRQRIARWARERQTRRSIAIPNRKSSAALNRLKKKFDNLCANDCAFALIGSVYIDIILRPIHTQTLGMDEWSNIDPIQLELGGSSIWVGRYLYSNHQQTCHLYTIVGGRDDPLNDAFNARISEEKWLLNSVVIGPSASRTAVTVHLVQERNAFTTMFTHRGVLSRLDWTYFQDQLTTTLSEGGVVYISGYFKTNLCTGLIDNLKNLAPQCLIVMEHGSFIRRLENLNALNILHEAFHRHLIDVYICTFSEFWRFCNYRDVNKKLPTDISVKRLLEGLAKEIDLPTMTVVRGADVPGDIKVYAIINGEVFPIQGTSGPHIVESSVGPKNAFNAALIYTLVNSAMYDTIEEHVVNSCLEALRFWQSC